MFVIFDDLYVYGKLGLWVFFLSLILVLDFVNWVWFGYSALVGLCALRLFCACYVVR